MSSIHLRRMQPITGLAEAKRCRGIALVRQKQIIESIFAAIIIRRPFESELSGMI